MIIKLQNYQQIQKYHYINFYNNRQQFDTFLQSSLNPSLINYQLNFSQKHSDINKNLFLTHRMTTTQPKKVSYESIIKTIERQPHHTPSSLNPHQNLNTHQNQHQKQNQNIIFGVQFKKPKQNLVLYKQHLYSIFLLLFYHGQLSHREMLIQRAEHCVKLLKIQAANSTNNNNNVQINVLDNNGVIKDIVQLQQQAGKSYNLIQYLNYTISAIANPQNSVNTFHTLQQRKKFRKSIKAICDITIKLTKKGNKNNRQAFKNLNFIDCAKLAGSLINVQCFYRDYHDIQIIQFQCQLFKQNGIQVFIQISKQNQTYRYVKQKRKKNYQDNSTYQMEDQWRKMGSQFSRDSFGSYVLDFRSQESQEQIIMEEYDQEDQMEQSVVARSVEQVQQSLHLKVQKNIDKSINKSMNKSLNKSKSNNKSSVKNSLQPNQPSKIIENSVAKVLQQGPRSLRVFKEDQVLDQFYIQQQKNDIMLVSQARSLQLSSHNQNKRKQQKKGYVNHLRNSQLSKNIKNHIEIQPKIFNTIGEQIQSQNDANDFNDASQNEKPLKKQQNMSKQQKQLVQKTKQILNNTTLLSFLKTLSKKDYKQYQKQLQKFGNLMKSKIGVQWLQQGLQALQSQMEESQRKSNGFANMIRTIFKENQRKQQLNDNKQQKLKNDKQLQKQSLQLMLQSNKSKQEKQKLNGEKTTRKIKISNQTNKQEKQNTKKQIQSQQVRQYQDQYQKQRQRQIQFIRQRQKSKQIERQRFRKLQKQSGKKQQKYEKIDFIRQFAQKQMKNNMNTLKSSKKQQYQSAKKTENRFATKLQKNSLASYYNSQSPRPAYKPSQSYKRTQDPDIAYYRSLDHYDPKNSEKQSARYLNNSQTNTDTINNSIHRSLNKYSRNYSPSPFYTELCMKYSYSNYIPRNKKYRYQI